MLPERYAEIPPLTQMAEGDFKVGQEAAREALDGFRTGLHHSVILIGGVGSGKTHLAAATYKDIIAQEKAEGFDIGDGQIFRFKEHMCFINIPHFISDIKRGFGHANDERSARIDHLIDKCRCAVLDDLGAERPTEFAIEQLLLLVDGLYSRKARIIATSNVKMSVLAETGGARLVSRLSEGAKVANVVTRDLRVSNER